MLDNIDTLEDCNLMICGTASVLKNTAYNSWVLFLFCINFFAQTRTVINTNAVVLYVLTT